MTAAGVTLAGRAAAEALMVDACAITRPLASAGQDETTGREVPATPTAIYTGPCRVQLENVEPAHPVAGDRVWTLQKAVISIPAAQTGPVVGDVVTITASALDSSMVGDTYRIRSVAAKTFLTARRMTCERVAG